MCLGEILLLKEESISEDNLLTAREHSSPIPSQLSTDS